MRRTSWRRSRVCLWVAVCLLAPAAAPAQDGCGDRREAVPAGERYFMVLAARRGVFYDTSGPAFSMAVRARAGQVQVDAVGVHAEGGRPAFGPVPPASYGDVMTDARDGADAILRVEIGRPGYVRALAVLRTWERRAREGALLYPEIAMNNILVVKQVTEGLKACGERLTLYPLDWGLEDDISERNLPPHIPFEYIRELRRLNQGRHLDASEMPSLTSGSPERGSPPRPPGPRNRIPDAGGFVWDR
jgi:hypothetical protein